MVVVFALGFVWFGYLSYQQQQSDLENAVETDGVVQDTSIEKDVSRRDRDDDGRQETETKYEPAVTYTYTYEGQNYTTDSVYSGGDKRFDDRSGARDVIDRYQSGETITVQVNSEEPDRAFLIERDASQTQFIFMGVGGFFALLGVGITLNSLRRLLT